MSLYPIVALRIKALVRNLAFARQSAILGERGIVCFLLGVHANLHSLGAGGEVLVLFLWSGLLCLHASYLSVGRIEGGFERVDLGGVLGFLYVGAEVSVGVELEEL